MSANVLDIIECMATSDNVIRAGLTPKLRDVPNLVSGLTYVTGASDRHFVQPVKFSAQSIPSFHTTLYDPPIPEFSVLDVTLQPQERETHGPINGPSLAIVIQGSGEVKWCGETSNVQEGEVVFIGAQTTVDFLAGNKAGMKVVRAFVEVKQ